LQRFTELNVWRRSHALALSIYRATARFPDYARFLNLAEGSAAELEYYLILARDLGFMTAPESGALCSETQEVARMLCGLRTKVEQTK
jgi:hypothetical protein